jgi:ubiquinone/menaquinone biosynthesis C-methylase UbiE
MSTSAWDETLESYDRTAPAYADVNWRNRLHRQMERFEGSLPGSHVLDLGCGPGRDVEWLHERGHHAVGMDVSTGMLAEARRRLPDAELVRADLADLPFPDFSFDGVWCCSVFVHLTRAQSAGGLVEIARVLRPGGAFYVGLEEGTEPEWRDDAHAGRRYFHFRQAGELAAEIEEAGFRVEDQYTEAVGPNRFLTTHSVLR